MMMRQILAAVAVVTLVAGCSGGTGSSGGSGSGSGGRGNPQAVKSAAAETAMFQFAKCMRDNGNATFPDPFQDKKGRWNFPPSTDHIQVPAACTAAVRRMKQQNPGDRPPSAADMAKLRRFAQCMRQHGLSEWPDPSADGNFKLSATLMNTTRADLAVRACSKLAPGGRWAASPTSGGQ